MLIFNCNSIFALNKDKITFSVWTENNIYAGLNETITLASKLDKANLAYILSEAFNLENVSTVNIDIKDVKNTHWAYQYICNVVENDIMPLYDGFFFPDEFIEREEIPQYFQFLDLSYPSIEGLEFNDLDKVTEEYRDMFLKFVASGYIKPISDVYLRPDRNLSITETINILNAMFPNIANGSTKGKVYDGHFLMKSYVNYLGNLDISGDLIISEGVILNNSHLDNNLVTLENVNVSGNIYIYGGTTYGEYVLKNVNCDNIVILTEDPVIMSLKNVQVNEIKNNSKLSNFITNQKINIVR
jgi:hypothetical protein